MNKFVETKLSIKSKWNSNLTNGHTSNTVPDNYASAKAIIFDGQLVVFDCLNIILKKNDVF